MRVAQSGMGTTPPDGRSIADGSGRRIRPGGMIGSIGGAPAGARSFASDRGRRRLDWKRMGGHMRGRMTRACGKADERTIDESIDGGCTLSHSVASTREEQNETQAYVDGTGGDVLFSVGRQALTRPSYERTRYPLSGSLVGVLGSLLGRESNSVRRPNPSKPLMYRMSIPPRTGPTSPAGCALRTLEPWTLSKNF